MPGSFVGTVVIWSFVYLRALAEMEAAGILSDVPVRVVTGPEEYLFGEEKALLEVAMILFPQLRFPWSEGTKLRDAVGTDLPRGEPVLSIQRHHALLA
ncbi:MAG: hypothetical protein M3499_05555 [Actinomycetota bacterium]|nr:hypothetical protein [Actinomycetota bacterium]